MANLSRGWQVLAAAACVLAAAMPASSEDGPQDILAAALRDPGPPPVYRLGAGRLDGDLGSADVGVGDGISSRAAQATGAPGGAVPARARSNTARRAS